MHSRLVSASVSFVRSIIFVMKVIASDLCKKMILLKRIVIDGEILYDFLLFTPIKQLVAIETIAVMSAAA